MKNSSVILLVCIVLLLAGYYFLGNGYFTARAAKQAAYEDITAAMQELANLPLVDTTIEERLARAGEDNEEALKLLPEAAGTTAIIDNLLQQAADHGVNVVPLSTEPWQKVAGEEMENLDLAVFRITFRVSGNYTSLKQFLSDLSGSMNNLVYDAVTLRPDNTGDTTGFFLSADVGIACYGRFSAAEDV